VLKTSIRFCNAASWICFQWSGQKLDIFGTPISRPWRNHGDSCDISCLPFQPNRQLHQHGINLSQTVQHLLHYTLWLKSQQSNLPHFVLEASTSCLHTLPDDGLYGQWACVYSGLRGPLSYSGRDASRGCGLRRSPSAKLGGVE
jgi:hypothetical protein